MFGLTAEETIFIVVVVSLWIGALLGLEWLFDGGMARIIDKIKRRKK